MILMISGQAFLWLLPVGCVLYYLALALAFRKKLSSPLSAVAGPHLQARATSLQADLIGRSIDIPVSPLELAYDPNWEEPPVVEMLDDQDSMLVKQAEKVVEAIDTAFAHFAPARVDEQHLRETVSSILSKYDIFYATEYFEAINSFIAQAIEQHFGLSWDQQAILPLWRLV